LKPLRVAVIGAGHLGRIHARLLKQVDAVELVAIVDPVEAARKQAEAECGAPVFADCRVLIGQIDAAVVATPTVHHHSVGVELLRSGVHLLIEKPIASTLAEANELVAAARASGAILQVGHIERFNPALSSIAGQVGSPKYIQTSRMSGYTFRSTDIGVVLDLMIHDIDLVLALTKSSVQKVEALGISVMGGHEDVAQARLTMASGCIANLTASRVSYRPERVMQVWSSECFAAIDFSTRAATIIRPCQELVRRELNVNSLPAERKLHLKDHLFEELLPTSTYQPDATNALLEELKDFAESIRHGHEPRVTGESGRDALAVAEQILGKIESHAWSGDTEGPIGPLLTPAPSILKGPHWSRDRLASDAPRRKEAS
jgi:predicted dehydrogenase